MAFLLDVFIGSVHIPLSEIWTALLNGPQTEDAISMIIWQSRLPRTITAMIAGIVLPVAGLLMQTFFRNPVAGPDILGISAGASLMVALVTMGAGAGGWLLGSNLSLISASIIGSVGVLLLMLAIAHRMRDAVSLLILGLMLGTAISAVTGILQYFSGRDALKLFVMWTFGSLGGVNWQQLGFLIPAAIITLSGSWLMARSLNLMLTGDKYAQSLGLRLRTSRLVLILLAGLATGSITAYCGPIAFVGIAVPHLARMLWKTTNHNVLVPGSALLGAMVMLLCDILSQVPGSDLVLPINAITALMGAPFVIFLLMRNQGLKNYF
jgi:iron complex transport system permease protein